MIYALFLHSSAPSLHPYGHTLQEDIHECRTYLEILRIARIRNGEKVKLKRHLCILPGYQDPNLASKKARNVLVFFSFRNLRKRREIKRRRTPCCISILVCHPIQAVKKISEISLFGNFWT